jgi:hypothetical protein
MEYFEEMVLETAIFKQHIRHLATWTRQAGWIPWPPERSLWEHKVHYGYWKRWPPTIPRHWYIP